MTIVHILIYIIYIKCYVHEHKVIYQLRSTILCSDQYENKINIFE